MPYDTKCHTCEDSFNHYWRSTEYGWANIWFRKAVCKWNKTSSCSVPLYYTPGSSLCEKQYQEIRRCTQRCYKNSKLHYTVARALNFRQFQALLGELKAKYDTLLMYNNVRWLSRGRVLERFIACLNEIRLFMYEKKQDFPQLTDVVWLNSLMFFTDLTMHFNALNTKLQGREKTAERMFWDIKAFERRLEVFEEDIKSGKLKYFSNLKTHLEDSNSTVFSDGSSSKQEIFKEFLSIILTTKENFSKRFAQFRKMEKTLYFLTFPDKTNFEDRDLSCLQWLGLENLEMELLEFKENYLWTCKFCDLRERLEKIECEGMMNENATSNSENEILKVWNSLPISFKSMKSLGIALLTLFGWSTDHILVSSCFRLWTLLNPREEIDLQMT